MRQMRQASSRLDDDDSKKSRGTDSGPFWCLVLVVAMLFVSVCLVLNGAKPSTATFLQKDLPTPPRPYEYGSFMKWLKQTDFAAVQSWKWKPEVVEFDLDAPAVSGKFAPYLKGHEGQDAISAAKHINKFLFMGGIMQSGDLNHVGGPGTHLYVIAKLAEGVASKGISKPTFLDAGCGPGYLLEAWVLIHGPGSRAVGIDLDPESVTTAKKYLASSEALDAVSQGKTAESSTEVYVGDAMRPRLATVAEGTVDAVNVGLAVKTLSDLDHLTSLLRPGGLLLAPICLSDAEQPKDVPKGKCEGRLRLFQKGSDEKLVRTAGDPEIPCRFVVSESKPVSNLRTR